MYLFYKTCRLDGANGGLKGPLTSTAITNAAATIHVHTMCTLTNIRYQLLRLSAVFTCHDPSARSPKSSAESPKIRVEFLIRPITAWTPPASPTSDRPVM